MNCSIFALIRAVGLPLWCSLAVAVLAVGCKDEPQVYSCLAATGATCDEYYGETQEDADALCTSIHTFEAGTCPTRNLIGRCEKPGTAPTKETYVVKSYYLPMPDGWDVNRLQSFCAKAKGRWLAPGDALTIPGKFVP